jgi:serine/threonine-protein kinase
MPLSAGTKLGTYEVLSAIGAGGMGEVYQAHDSNLRRDVAIKVLPEAFAHDADRLSRFRREAQLLAALNHSNIATIYGLEETNGTSYLVMELVPGETLAQRIKQNGAVAVEEALTIAKQIAEALEYAHDHSVIHRDLKPANVKLTPEGKIKVLDFGLAKAFSSEATTDDIGNSPTLSMAATMQGVILGTAAYMSPEQAKGKAVDKRTDIWAFGAVLYELLTGKQAFQGDDVSEILAAVLRAEPDWTALPAEVPPAIRALVARCLAKDRKQRMRDIGDVQLVLNGAFEAPAQPAGAATPSAAVPRPLWKRAVPVVVAAVVASAIVGAAAWMLWPPAPSSPVTRFALALGEGQQITIVNNQTLAISPDGTHLAYVAFRGGTQQLYLRAMDSLEAMPVPGTQGTASAFSPVFSPDGQSIAFLSQADRAVKKVAVSGGAVVTICPVVDALPRVLGMTWDAGGIVFGQGKGIMRVSANGGQPEVLISVKDGEVIYGPQVLPGGEWVLFTVATAATAEGWDKAQIVVQSLKSSERKTLVSGGSDARYLPTGHLVYALAGVLFAVPFDLRRLAVTGGPVPVVEGVRRSQFTGTAHFSVSNTGSLVFVPGPASTSSALSDLALVDRNGTVQPLKLPPGAYEYPRLSPDGKRIAVGSDDGKDAIVWIYDVAGASSARRLTLGGRNRVPVWSADGERVAFQSDRDGDLGIFWQRADGTTTAERLTKPDKDTAHVPESWSPDGKTLLFSIAKGSSGYSLAALSLTDKKVTPVGGIQSLFPPSATFSPDGRWVAYSATAPGSPLSSLFVQPFPMTGATYPISKSGGGFHPTWSPDGKELFYFAGGGGGQFVAVSVTTRPTFTFGNPVLVSKPFVERGPGSERNNDITLDGKRFLGVVTAGQTASAASAAPQIQVVLNWFEELKAKVPTK